MSTSMDRVSDEIKRSPFSLNDSVDLYRNLRNLCCLLERCFPGIYHDAGFKVDIEWTEGLGTDPEVM